MFVDKQQTVDKRSCLSMWKKRVGGGAHKKANGLRSDRKERQRAEKRSKKERRAWCVMAGIGV